MKMEAIKVNPRSKGTDTRNRKSGTKNTGKRYKNAIRNNKRKC